MKDAAQKPDRRLSDAAKMEDALAAALNDLTGEISHTECFDTEQRAEIYTILDAMRGDVENHQKLLGTWVNDQTGEVRHV